MKTLPFTMVALVFLSAFLTPAQAQTFTLDWYTIDGGGGASTGGAYTVSGTIGQPEAGTMSGGVYTLIGGFWSAVAAVQIPGAPRLSIAPSTGAVIVSWPLPAPGWVLDETATLNGTPIPWTEVLPPYQASATHSYITVPSMVGNKFYRLRKP